MTMMATPAIELVLRADDGTVLADEGHRWFDDATDGERTFLRSLVGPVLDVGCGPGRLVAALHEMGTPSLGVDIAPAAVELTRSRGAAAIARCVFDRLPGEGRWATVIVADGNIGIGGDPQALLARLAQLVANGGVVAIEAAAAGTGLRQMRVRIERDGEASGWFRWATADESTIGRLGLAAGLMSFATVSVAGRPFVMLRATGGDR